MSLETPIAFFIFNRPAVTAQVFSAIATARPKKLLVVADGPRTDRPGEAQQCEATRDVLKKVDWPCDVQTDFAAQNLGCGKRVASGLDWVFSICEQAIILEDDCLPGDDFFPFCEALLDRYRDDPRIMHIGGNNFHGDAITYPGSYYFTRYPHIWGWATWRRAWQQYDFDIKSWPALRDRGGMAELCATPDGRSFFERNFAAVHSRALDTWDVQWTYNLMTHGGLAINPAKNLVSNLGFGVDATHTHGGSWMGNLPTYPLGKIRHPDRVIEHRTADERTLNIVFDVSPRRPTLRQRVVRAARKHLARNAKGRAR